MSPEDDTVTPVDISTNEPGTPILVGDEPLDIDLEAHRPYAYVTNHRSGSVTRIDTTTNVATNLQASAHPRYVAASDEGIVYVTDSDGTVTSIDGNTGLRLDTYTLGAGPNAGIALVDVPPPVTSPADLMAYVACWEDSTLVPVDLATGLPGTPIPLAEQPHEVVVTPDGAKAYVMTESTVVPVDLRTGTAGTLLSIPEGPFGLEDIALTADGRRAYVADGVTDGNGTIVPIDTATDARGTPIPVGSRPESVAITPDGKAAYVGLHEGVVIPVDLATGTSGEPIEVGAQPDTIVVAGDGTHAYVENSANDTRISRIDVASNTVVDTLDQGVWGLALSPDGETLFANVRDQITLIDSATLTVDREIDVANEANGLAIAPGGEVLYVSHFDRGSLTPIVPSTGTRGVPIRVGPGATDVAIAVKPAPVPTPAPPPDSDPLPSPSPSPVPEAPDAAAGTGEPVGATGSAPVVAVDPASGGLARTGATTVALVAVAALLLSAGATALVAGQRRTGR